MSEYGVVTIIPPDDALYVRYNEFGGVKDPALTAARIRELVGTNGWEALYDSARDEWFCWHNGQRAYGHNLTRIRPRWEVPTAPATDHDPECTGCEHDCPWNARPMGAPFCLTCDDHAEACGDPDS